MSWVAAAVTVGTAAYGAYNAYSTKQDAKNNAKNIFGTRPQVAPYTPTNLSDEARRAIEANSGNSDSIMAMLERFVPGYADILRQGSENTLSQLRGEIPADVQAQIQRSTAFQSLLGGFGGTDMGHALTARDLGRTSLDLTTMGNNSAQLWTKLATDTAKPWMITGEQQAQATAANNANQQATQQYGYNVAAGRDPSAAGIFNTQIATNAATQQSLNQAGSAFTGYGGYGGAGAYGMGGTGAQMQGSPWTMYSGGAGGAYQYNSLTGQYSMVPRAQYAGSG